MSDEKNTKKCEALRSYERERWWQEMNTYGREKAEALGIHEEEVERLIEEARKETSGARSPRERDRGVGKSRFQNRREEKFAGHPRQRRADCAGAGDR